MRPLHYAINITLDGCIDHTAVIPTRPMHEYATANVARADAIILGRVTYELMEAGWREVAETGVRPDWMEDWMESFAHTIHAKKKYLVSSTRTDADWNATERLRGDLGEAVRQLKAQPGGALAVGGVRLPMALAELGLIDQYEFIVHPVIAGRGPSLFAGLAERIELRPVGRVELGDGVVAVQYVPRTGGS